MIYSEYIFCCMIYSETGQKNYSTSYSEARICGGLNGNNN